MRMNNNLKGFSALLLAGAIYGTFGIWIRLLHREITSYQQITFRNATAFLFALCLIFLMKKNLFLKKFNRKYIIFYCISSSLSIVFFTLSALMTKIAVA